MSRELLERAIDALQYHTQQTRPIHNTELMVDALREALAAPQPGPVARVVGGNSPGATPWVVWIAHPQPADGSILYAAPPAAPAPAVPRHVRKIGGSFQHSGTVVAEFKTTAGEPRIVLEFDAPVAGMLHVYRPDQVEPCESAAPAVPDLKHKPTVQRLMDLARKFRATPGDLYDGAYKELQQACYEALSAAPAVPTVREPVTASHQLPLTDGQMDEIWDGAFDSADPKRQLSFRQSITRAIEQAHGIGTQGGGK